MTRQGTTKQIRVMISSRCSDQIRQASGEPIGLFDLRFDMKKQIEDAEIFGKKSFQCFAHEHEPALSALGDFWEECLEEVQKCDILIVLYNGNAGFANKDGDLGICHVELMRALDTAPGKVRIVDVRRDASLPELPVYPKDQMERNQRFAEYLAFKQRGVRFAKDAEDAIEQTRAAPQDAVVDLVTWGGREARKGRFDEGAPLVWSRMDYSTRKREMEAVLRRHLAPDVRSAKQPITKRVDDATVLFCCHAVPSAMSTAAAREMVGRPFLKDHELVAEMAESFASGPFHLIACHKNVTEGQAINLLGFPDATVVTPAFGVYVADPVQNIQLAFLANCRDESTTRFAVQRFNEWLYSSGEAEYLARRARKRKIIVEAIAGQLSAEQPAESGPRTPAKKQRAHR